MSQVQSAVLTELHTARALRRKLLERIGDACSEQRARYSELDAQFAELEQRVACGDCSDELLVQATELNTNLSKLRQRLKDGWAISLGATA